MQVDFYQLSRDPIERVVPLLAAKAVEQGDTLAVVHGDAAAREGLSDALWTHAGTFLANGPADGAQASRQPVVLGNGCAAPNGARVAILADGVWREDVVTEFERTILLFGPEHTGSAQSLWRALTQAGHSLRIFKQSASGGWREGR